jgi:uncharacterized circularly permuted ATP-grasp superfamily protein
MTDGMQKAWKSYDAASTFDESIAPTGSPRLASRRVVNYLQKLDMTDLAARQAAADLAIREMGISFTVYSESGNIDRAWPFDLIPRIIRARDWKKVSAGLMQRSRALNAFIEDVYNRQRILKDGIVPGELIEESDNYRPECRGIKLAHGAWAHVCGTDLVRDDKGKYLVLEDNLRVPSGVSYMIENREITKRVMPDLFHDCSIMPVDDYPERLFETLASISPKKTSRPCIVVLTPGIYNSAYFEHAYLAQGMGAELVEGSDLFVEDECVYMRTVEGPQRVDVIYRRIDDQFLDPDELRSDSVLGAAGLMAAWRAGNVAIANAPGSGVADDKVIYAFVPEMVRYYLNEEPLIENVETWLCMRERDRDYVLRNIEKLVVKPANESGGYGIMVGPASTPATHDKFRRLIEADPRNYVAQPTLKLSTAPTICDDRIEPRHVDLRPFILNAKNTWVTPGGLTRVALRKGSLVVNSSQGGGSKDTWVVEA